jgi:hypothetical protein
MKMDKTALKYGTSYSIIQILPNAVGDYEVTTDCYNNVATIWHTYRSMMTLVRPGLYQSGDKKRSWVNQQNFVFTHLVFDICDDVMFYWLKTLLVQSPVCWSPSLKSLTTATRCSSIFTSMFNVKVKQLSGEDNKIRIFFFVNNSAIY